MSNVPDELPQYIDLPFKDGNPAKTAWGLFGDNDDVGMLNLQSLFFMLCLWMILTIY